MKIVSFTSDGGPLSVNIKYESLTAENFYSTYTYTLWAAASNAVVDQKSGNNFNDEDDNYWLPTPAAGNTGRIIDVFSTLKNAGTDPLQVRVTVTVCQSSVTVDSETDTKTIDPNATAFSEIFIKLLLQQ